jgi:hypothetical protein
LAEHEDEAAIILGRKRKDALSADRRSRSRQGLMMGRERSRGMGRVEMAPVRGSISE